MSSKQTTFVVDEDEVRKAYADHWWMFLIAGLLWLIFGFMVLSLRPASIAALVILISIGFWLGALTQFVLAAVSSGGWRVLAIIGGVLAIGAGIAALVWPGPTLVVVSIFVAWYLLVRGAFDVAISLSHTHVRGWWMGLVAGIISIGLGAWAIGNPDRSVLLFVTIVGIWAIFKGATDLVAAFTFREVKKELASV
ncbi:MAG: DUF308 domain-containing protein [Acidimicrobiia bacterium]